jgi:hypothetical protein
MKRQWRRAVVLVSLGLIWSLALPLRATADREVQEKHLPCVGTDDGIHGGQVREP